MADDKVKDETEETAPEERTMVRIRLKKKVIETPRREKVVVNGEEWKLSSDSDVEVPDFVLDHVTEYDLVDEKGNVLPPAPPEPVEVDEDGKPKPKRKRSSR